VPEACIALHKSVSTSKTKSSPKCAEFLHLFVLATVQTAIFSHYGNAGAGLGKQDQRRDEMGTNGCIYDEDCQNMFFFSDAKFFFHGCHGIPLTRQNNLYYVLSSCSINLKPNLLEL
jgi:hypothetical protein